MFITLDGPNGVGKSTVASLLSDLLRANGNDVKLLRQPSDSDLGNFARRSEGKLHGLGLAAVVVADRYLQIDAEIKPALAAGRVVLCDRYVASTLALQRLDDVSIDVLWDLNSEVLVPDLSVLLTADAATIDQRLTERGRVTRFELVHDLAVRELMYFEEAFQMLKSKGYRTAEISTTGVSPEATAGVIREQVAEL